MSNTHMGREPSTVASTSDADFVAPREDPPSPEKPSTSQAISSCSVGFAIGVGAQASSQISMKLDTKRIAEQELFRQANAYLRGLGGAE